MLTSYTKRPFLRSFIHYNYLNLTLQVLLLYLRNCVKNAERIAISSCDLSLAILHARAEINVTNSQLFIVKPSLEYHMFHLFFWYLGTDSFFRVYFIWIFVNFIFWVRPYFLILVSSSHGKIIHLFDFSFHHISGSIFAPFL